MDVTKLNLEHSPKNSENKYSDVYIPRKSTRSIWEALWDFIEICKEIDLEEAEKNESHNLQKKDK